MKCSMTSPKTIAALSAAAAATGLGELKAPAADLRLDITDARSPYVYLRCSFPADGEYSIEYSPNLADWYPNQPQHYYAGTAHSVDPTPFEPGAPAAAFYRLEAVTDLSQFQTNWVRKGDYLLGVRVVTGGGVQTFQVKDVRTSAVRDVVSIPSSQGTINSFWASYDFAGYSIDRPGQGSETTLQGLNSPINSFVIDGELQAMYHASGGAIGIFVLRDFAYAGSGIQYSDRMLLDGQGQNLTSIEQTFIGGAIYDRYRYIVAATRTNQVAAGQFNSLVDIYDVTAGLDHPQKMYSADLGTNVVEPQVTLKIPDQFGANRYVLAQESGSVPADTVLIDPTRQAMLRLPVDTRDHYYTFNEDQAGFFGYNRTETWVDLGSFTVLPPRTFPTQPVVLQNFDGTSMIAPLSSHDPGTYQFTTVGGVGTGGSNAMQVVFNKSGYGYAYFTAGLTNPVVDFSLFSSVSMQVRNLSAAPLTLILKFEKLCGYAPNGICGAIEQSFAIPAYSAWTPITYTFPQHQERGILYLTEEMLLFAAPGQYWASGSFLMDDIKLNP